MRSNKALRLLAVLAFALAMSVAAGCGRDDDEGGGGESGKPGNVAGFDGKTIKLGVVTP